jgi:hypothetical protein
MTLWFMLAVVGMWVLLSAIVLAAVCAGAARTHQAEAWWVEEYVNRHRV